MHFLSGSETGVEFAHKTVGEYFTAVKLYEDYFGKIRVSSDADEVWEQIYQAFRYAKIPEDIMYVNCKNWGNLNGANLMRANLLFANLNGADLSRADLIGAHLRETDLY